MASFNFTPRLGTGQNGSRSVNAILSSLITAIADYLDNLLYGGIDTENLVDSSITGNKISTTAFSFRCIAGADSTSAAVDLTATGALATDRIVAVLDLTTHANLSLEWFTPGADKITQVIGHDLDASNLLFVLLADETE
jgi:hypothetical protein